MTLRACICVLAWALSAGTADGGIAGLQTWFRRKFPTAFEPISEAATREYEHVLVDMNQVLHHAVRKANDLEHAKILVFMELNLQLQRCVPRSSVVLAFDGPGPRAKLITQRRRRAKRKTPAGKLSSMLITPGSAFMRDMHEACMYYACRRLQNEEAYRTVKFWVSGSQVPGEGEVKIIDWLNCHLPPATPGEPDTRSVCVIGSDVDLVLQCISALPRLMSGALPSAAAAAAAPAQASQGEADAAAPAPGGGPSARGGHPRRSKLAGAAAVAVAPATGAEPSFRFEVLTHSTSAKTHLGSRRRGVPWVRISVLELAAQLEASFPQCSASQITHDLTALLCMFGNDYLPRLRGCTLSLLYETYVQLKRTPQFGGARGLVDDRVRSFDVQFLHALMRMLGSRSHEIAHVSAHDLAQMRRATDEATVWGSVFAMKLNECSHVLKLGERPRYKDERLTADLWRSSVSVGGATFWSDAGGQQPQPHAQPQPQPQAFQSLKHAQWEAARNALAALCPERYEAAVRSVELAQRRLERYQHTGEHAGDPRRSGTAGAAGGARAAVSNDGLGVTAAARRAGEVGLRGSGSHRAGAAGEAEEDEEEESAFDGEAEADGADDEPDDDEAVAAYESASAADAGSQGSRLYDASGYLRGVLWTLQMYIDGNCPDYSFAYGARLAPSPAQVIQFLESVPEAVATSVLVPPMSSVRPPSPSAILVSLVPVEWLMEVAPAITARLSDATLSRLRTLEADEERSLASELEVEERGKRSMLESLSELMSCAEADVLGGIDAREAEASGAACKAYWQTIARAPGASAGMHHAVPGPPTTRSMRIRPFGLTLSRVRATFKPPCRPWAHYSGS